MKQRKLLLTLCLAALLALSACGQRACGDGPAQAAAWMEGRVVAVDGGQLLLAKTGGSLADVYVVWVDQVTPELEGKEIRPGALVSVGYDGAIEETFPARLGQACALTVKEEGFDDLAALYLQVFDDLWQADAALNDGVTQLGLDLTKTSLSPSEQGALGVALSGRLELPVSHGSWEEMAEQGIIDGETLQWTDGAHLSIAEEAGQGLTFTAQKWRSGTGAFLYTGCTAQQDAGGHWTDYTVGAEAMA